VISIVRKKKKGLKMAGKSRHFTSYQIAELKAVGARTCEIARSLGTSTKTVERWIRDPAKGIPSLVDRIRNDLLDEVSGMLSSEMIKNVTHLKHLRETGSEKTQLSACRCLSDFCLRFRELMHVEARLEVLERERDEDRRAIQDLQRRDQ
jgi:hypothetical protein